LRETRRRLWQDVRAHRNQMGGASMAEFGPALWVLLICFFFPVMILLFLAASYASIMVLNNLQSHEASLLPYQDAQDPAGRVIKTIPTEWMTGGLGKFVNPVGTPDTQVTYQLGSSDVNNTQDHYVVVVTKCSIAPILPIAFFQNVPGISAPVDFTISSQRLMENQDNAPP
jgi:hypothetical protein